MKPTVLVLTSTFPRNENDHEPRFVSDLCMHLQSQFEIHILTQHRPDTKLYESRNGIKIQRFRYAPERWEVLSETGGLSNTLSQKPWTWVLVPFLMVSQIWSTIKLIREFKPNIVHCHWLIPQTLSAAIAIRLSNTKCKLVSTSHGADVYSFRAGIFKSLKQKILK